MKADVAVIGTGVMGSNLARNLADRGGVRVAIYDRDIDRARGVGADHPEADFLVADSPAELAQMLTGPRVAILMVNAGPATDSAIGDLSEVFAPGDIIVDGGNSHFADTRSRGERLSAAGLEFSGIGISGGEVGALLGPSMMVGGSSAAWDRLRPLLEPIAAQAPLPDSTGTVACVDHIGPDGAGHFVKMVHNGIEYADMQLIAEACTVLREGLGLTPARIAEVLREWNEGELASYLIEVTIEVLEHTDADTGRPFVDIVADAARAKGTGAWTAQTGLALSVPVPAIAEAVFSRSLSSSTELRASGASLLGPSMRSTPSAETSADDAAAAVEQVRLALHMGKVLAYVQGFHEITVGAGEYGWNIDLGGLASIWRAGCIIRARLLDRIVDAYDRDSELPSLVADPSVRTVLEGSQAALRTTVTRAVERGIPVPGLSSVLAYYDGIRASHGSAALIQAQRDFFGSHTYSRTDRLGTFHTLWSEDRREIEL